MPSPLQSAAGAGADADAPPAERAALRRNRLVFGLVVAPIGVLIALFVGFLMQIDAAWAGVHHGDEVAGPLFVAIGIGLVATVPALIAGIRALRDKAWVGLASATTVVSGIGLVAVALLVVVPAFDLLPRSARQADAYREQQQREELEDVGYDGPSSAEAAGASMQSHVADALDVLDLRESDVEQRTWFSTSTTALGNRCRSFRQRVDLPSALDRVAAEKTLTASWSTGGNRRDFGTTVNGNPLLLDMSAESTITFDRREGTLFVASDCIPYADAG
ncbi:hypothetical protein [Curtobacterium sp. MCLR17_055]|uniref:hypothetical protein n=1 Tax=Curtobacterium sp. MCLR17_055 TaxID=2175633 RepID=UPI000DA81CB0|nr:hypothetical protein [Curtobacterium sp. MCLR17_055]PZE26363.1 hypothetical protein DEJ09_14205 [Curtobacterium sp. MCLR17_055]